VCDAPLKVNNLLEQCREKARSPLGSVSPTLAPRHSLQHPSDAERARVEAGIFMLNEIFPNDIIVHDCMNPKAKNQKDGTKAVISRASLIHLQAKDHRRSSAQLQFCWLRMFLLCFPLFSLTLPQLDHVSI
jgi:hypothetical protein